MFNHINILHNIHLDELCELCQIFKWNKYKPCFNSTLCLID